MPTQSGRSSGLPFPVMEGGLSIHWSAPGAVGSLGFPNGLRKGTPALTLTTQKCHLHLRSQEDGCGQHQGATTAAQRSLFSSGLTWGSLNTSCVLRSIQERDAHGCVSSKELSSLLHCPQIGLCRRGMCVTVVCHISPNRTAKLLKINYLMLIKLPQTAVRERKRKSQYLSLQHSRTPTNTTLIFNLYLKVH